MVISHWSGEVCTAAAAAISIDEASTLIGVLVPTLREAVVPPPGGAVGGRPLDWALHSRGPGPGWLTWIR